MRYAPETMSSKDGRTVGRTDGRMDRWIRWIPYIPPTSFGGGIKCVLQHNFGFNSETILPISLFRLITIHRTHLSINGYIYRIYPDEQLTKHVNHCCNACDTFPDSKVHGANMGSILGRQDPGGPHVGPMNFAIWVMLSCSVKNSKIYSAYHCVSGPNPNVPQTT